jgi:hypothetical protein
MNKVILFFLGLLTGIMICVSIYYVDRHLLKPVRPATETKEVVALADKVYVEEEPAPEKQIVENKPIVPKVVEKEAEEQPEEKISLFDTEFSYEEEQQNDVFKDQMLQSKMVKAVLHPLEKKENKNTEGFFYIFELQQWDTPIKNKLTYSRYQTLVKVKGLDIKNANVVFWNENFYLEVNKRYYLIPETDSFEKLNVATIP